MLGFDANHFRIPPFFILLAQFFFSQFSCLKEEQNNLVPLSSGHTIEVKSLSQPSSREDTLTFQPSAQIYQPKRSR